MKNQTLYKALFISALMLMLPLLSNSSDWSVSDEESHVTLVEKIELKNAVMHELFGVLDDAFENEDRPLLANSRIGVYDAAGLLLKQDIPDEGLIPRPDLAMFLVDNSLRIQDVRSSLEQIHGLEVRAFISPSGLLVQGTKHSLEQGSEEAGIEAMLPVPVAMMVDEYLWFESPEKIRLESWRGDELHSGVGLVDSEGHVLQQSLTHVSTQFLKEINIIDTGRISGVVNSQSVFEIALEPSVSWVRAEPMFTIDNNYARSHMAITGSYSVRSHFTTDLDGSGQIVAVADSGLDEDHGDFGTRIIESKDVIGDGSTADTWSGHGTHVACTVLGDGTRGPYAGVAPASELYFQAMENDNTGNFVSPSLNYLFNDAYGKGARIHTNSWGSSQDSDQGKYTSESEDVDDRANYYDRFYNNVEGLSILFASGNDGSGSGTVNSPGTAKNAITVGSHLNRGGSAPNLIWDSSSRGPTDDQRIKPDIVAPGAYVRSCKAQEANDVAGTWEDTYYVEYSGTSMATPNAAGAAALIREYILEIAERPAPQGSLVKALLVLGARDVGARDIPNNDEGWGRVDLKESLAPGNGRGIWVDDRSIMSHTGHLKSYTFNVTDSGQPLKAVLAWSDERGSRFSTNQLVNNLNLEVEKPDGTLYKGNYFSQGRSIQGGDYDAVNNLEVVLIDNAESGIWTIRVKDGGHGGSYAQPYALAVSGMGVNDLRPDPVVLEDYSINVDIPQLGDTISIQTTVQNFGNVEAQNVAISFEVEGSEVSSQSVDLNPGASKVLEWEWTPLNDGSIPVSFVVDPDNLIEEISESNNRFNTLINVTTPGIKIESTVPSITLRDSDETVTSWNITLTNTALIPTNGTLDELGVIRNEDNLVMDWFVGIDRTVYELNGSATVPLSVTLVHPKSPDPGTYIIQLLGQDLDNNIDYPFSLEFVVPLLTNPDLETYYDWFPVSPFEPTSVNFLFHNAANGQAGYDLFLTPALGWMVGFDDLSSQGGANSASTGMMAKGEKIPINITVIPPQVTLVGGTELTFLLTIVTQSEDAEEIEIPISMKVEEVPRIDIISSTNYGDLSKDSVLSLNFLVENTGNIDLNLSPQIITPLGWEVTTSVSPFSLPWSGNNEFQLIFRITDTATSGEIELILSDGSFSHRWNKSANVLQTSDGTISFARLEIEGEKWTDVMGPGSHPPNKIMNFSWVVSNDATTLWHPIASIASSDGIIGTCSDLPSIGKNQEEILVCSILIEEGVLANSEPEFSLRLIDGTDVVTSSHSLLVEAIRAISWNIPDQTFEINKVKTVDVEITNIGSVSLSHQIRAMPPEGWSLTFAGDGVLDIQPGESHIEEIQIKPLEEGSGNVKIWLSSGQDVSNFEHEFSVTTNNLNTDGISSNGDGNSLIGISIFALIMIVLTSLIILQVKSNKNNSHNHSAQDSSFSNVGHHQSNMYQQNHQQMHSQHTAHQDLKNP